MTHLFINPNNEYPRHVGDILLEDPSYDGVNLPAGWKPVDVVAAPVPGDNEVVYEGLPEMIDGVYRQSWLTRQMTDEEIERKNNPPTSWQEVKDSLPFL